MGGAHDLTDEKAVELVAPGAVLGDLIRLGGEDRVDYSFDRSRIGDLAQAFCLHDCSGVGAGGNHVDKNILGKPGGDRAIGNEID